MLNTSVNRVKVDSFSPSLSLSLSLSLYFKSVTWHRLETKMYSNVLLVWFSSPIHTGNSSHKYIHWYIQSPAINKWMPLWKEGRSLACSLLGRPSETRRFSGLVGPCHLALIYVATAGDWCFYSWYFPCTFFFFPQGASLTDFSRIASIQF